MQRFRSEAHSSHTDSERLKSLQSHSAEQQALLSQLQARLQDTEAELEAASREKTAALEDANARLKANVGTVGKLNQQMSALQKDNRRLRVRRTHFILFANNTVILCYLEAPL